MTILNTSIVLVALFWCKNKPWDATSETDFPWEAAILPTTAKITKPAKILVAQFMIEIRIESLKMNRNLFVRKRFRFYVISQKKRPIYLKSERRWHSEIQKPA